MTRWWADPDTARPYLEAVDGSAPHVEMGIAVLGMHALAKAALEPLSRRTLVDEATIIDALRGVDYRPVAEAIHSATCEDLGHTAASKYAVLVTEQLLDQTVESATAIPRALVAKQMSWPRAVGLAAEVAVVPLRRTGRYATVAAAFGRDGLGIQDAADRTLLDYASWRGSQEPVSEEIAKGRHRPRHRHQIQQEVWDESQVNRDQLGRFAEEADTEQRKLKDQMERARKERQARMARQTRIATQAQTERQTKTQAQTERQTQSQQAKRGESLTQQRVQTRGVERRGFGWRMGGVDESFDPAEWMPSRGVILNSDIGTLGQLGIGTAIYNRGKSLDLSEAMRDQLLAQSSAEHTEDELLVIHNAIGKLLNTTGYKVDARMQSVAQSYQRQGVGFDHLVSFVSTPMDTYGLDYGPISSGPAPEQYHVYDEDAIREALEHQGAAFSEEHTAIFLVNGTNGPEYRVVNVPQKFGLLNRSRRGLAVVVMDRAAEELFNLIYEMTLPNTKETAKRRRDAIAEADERLSDADDTSLPEAQQSYPYGMVARITGLLAMEDIRADEIGPAGKKYLGALALTTAGDGAVRLDGIDVVRISRQQRDA